MVSKAKFIVLLFLNYLINLISLGTAPPTFKSIMKMRMVTHQLSFFLSPICVK